MAVETDKVLGQMSNLLEKPERGHAQVSGIRKDHGRFSSRLTSPSHGRAFFYARHSGGVENLYVIAASLLLSWAVVFWIAALLSYLLGFSGVAATTFYIANVLGGITLLLAVLFFVFRRYSKRDD